MHKEYDLQSEPVSREGTLGHAREDSIALYLTAASVNSSLDCIQISAAEGIFHGEGAGERIVRWEAKIGWLERRKSSDGLERKRWGQGQRRR